MAGHVTVTLQPAGRAFDVPRGEHLLDLLVRHGCEIPCGGEGICGGCGVRVLDGALPITPADRDLFDESDLAQGWRLGCQARAEGDVTLSVAGGAAPVLGDAGSIAGARRGGLGVAIDLGTTTLAVQLLDLRSGALLGSASALNEQAVFGADLMSRVRAAVSDDAPTRMIRAQLGRMVRDLAAGREAEIVDVAIVGNTVMHHIVAGLDLQPFTGVPFRSPALGEQRLVPADLGWEGFANAPIVRVLPCLGGFVGSDILAGIVAVGLAEQDGLRALIDLGTNGEIVLGNRSRLLVASTAAGTAFEAGSIAMGMRAATGAISRVRLRPDGGFVCDVIGGGEPRGLCGSGVVAAVAAGLDAGAILPSGRLAHRAKRLPLAGRVQLTQGDVRELQLAKGAIAAGMRILLRHWGVGMEAVETLYLAGAFGNYVDTTSAVRIGLLESPVERIVASGNTALRGAKLLLGRDATALLGSVAHVSLAAEPDFHDIFAACMGFPGADEERAGR